MLLRIFQGSKPMAASTTPTTIESSASRNATASGEPPRNRYRPSLAAGNSRVSLGIDGLPRALMDVSYSTAEKMGNPLVGVNGRLLRTLAILCRLYDMNRCSCRIGLQHPLQRFQPVGLARRLIPAQPVDARKPHRDAGFMPGGARQALEGDFQHQPLIRLVHD